MGTWQFQTLVHLTDQEAGGTHQSSTHKLSGSALMPILCSSEPHFHTLRSPSFRRWRRQELGHVFETTKLPLGAGAQSGSLARNQVQQCFRQSHARRRDKDLGPGNS